MRIIKILLAIIGGIAVILIILAIVSGGKFHLGTTPESRTTEGAKDRASSSVQAPASDEAWIQGVLFQGSLADVSLRFVDASVSMNELFTQAPTLSRETRIALLDQTIQKWQAARSAAEQFSAVVDFLPVTDKTTSRRDPQRFALINTARAGTLEETIKNLEEEEKRLEGESKVYEKEKELGRKQILQIVDQAPSGQKLKVAADLFGTDAMTAYDALTKMRALESKIALNQADVLDTYSKTAETIKTGAKVGIFIAGLAPAAGGSAVAFAGKAGVDLAVAGANIVFTGVAGADLVMEVSETAVNIGVADKNGAVASIANAKDAEFFKNMSLVVGVMDPLKAVGQLQKVMNAAGGLKNLLTSDGLKKIVGNKALINDMKADASGNLQTIVDSGPKTWELIMGNPEAKTLILDASKPGAPVVVSDQKPVVIQSLPTEAEISAFIQNIYSEAKKAAEDAVSAPTETGQPVVPEKPSYDGTYSGSTDAASGMATASMTVEGTALFGRATYRETKEGQAFRIGLNISGSVNEEGRVSGRISGSQVVGDRTVTVNGSFSGGIYGNSMSIRFRATSSATGDTSGSITLTK